MIGWLGDYKWATSGNNGVLLLCHFITYLLIHLNIMFLLMNTTADLCLASGLLQLALLLYVT